MRLKKLIRLVWLNFLWILFCIPIITSGASTCAAYGVSLRLVADDESVSSFGDIWRRFLKGFKQDFVQGTFMLLFSVACGTLGYYLIRLVKNDVTLIKIAGLAVYFFVVLVFNFYAYPLIARYTNSFKNVLRNSVALFFIYLKMSGKYVCFAAVEAAALYFSRYIFFAGFLILPSIIFYTISIPAKDIFEQTEHPKVYDEDGNIVDNSGEAESESDYC